MSIRSAPASQRPFRNREEAGRVMEPRKKESRGHQETAQRRIEENADGFQWPEGSSPRRAQASVEDTTGV